MFKKKQPPPSYDAVEFTNKDSVAMDYKSGNQTLQGQVANGELTLKVITDNAVYGWDPAIATITIKLHDYPYLIVALSDLLHNAEEREII